MYFNKYLYFKKHSVLCGGSLNYQFKNSIHKNLQDPVIAYASLCICGLGGRFLKQRHRSPSCCKEVPEAAGGRAHLVSPAQAGPVCSDPLTLFLFGQARPWERTVHLPLCLTLLLPFLSFQERHSKGAYLPTFEILSVCGSSNGP